MSIVISEINTNGDESNHVKNEYEWRNYIWRTYKDVWIGEMTYAEHKDGGYCICAPDPEDHTMTHIIRIDEYPIDSQKSKHEKGSIRYNFLIGTFDITSTMHCQIKLILSPS